MTADPDYFLEHMTNYGALYCASKWGLEGMSKAFALDLARAGIRSNTIAPTFIETPMTRPFFEDNAFLESVLAKIKLGRLGRVEDLMGAVVYLASDASALVGQSPVQLAHEVEGFLLNRLQWALMGEALHLVGEGLCSPADIGRVMTDGLARRWSFIGPFMVAHLNASAGVRGYYAGLAEAIGRVQASLRTDYPPSPALVDRLAEALEAQVPVDEIAARQAWRDKMLLARRAPKAPTR